MAEQERTPHVVELESQQAIAFLTDEEAEERGATPLEVFYVLPDSLQPSDADDEDDLGDEDDDEEDEDEDEEPSKTTSSLLAKK